MNEKKPHNPWKKSDEAKRHMSESANKKWASELGRKLKQRLSELTAQKIASGQQKKTNRGYFYSTKMGDYIAWYSTYELKALTILEADDKVLNYQTAHYYHVNGRSRVADILVNNNKIIEVKPQDILDRNYPKVIEQIKDAKSYCDIQKYEYEIWTEKELGFASYNDARMWSDEFRKTLEGIDYPAVRKKKGRDRANKHYWLKIAGVTVTNFCKHCKCSHTQLKVTFMKNIKKNNGEYICWKENGRRIGKLPKDHLKKINPYAHENKQECINCKNVLDYSNFSVKDKKIGKLMNVCKVCRSKKALEKYHATKK
jgi:hypothetical protein